MEKDTFYIEEYKSLRDEITTKLKSRLDFHNWGLIALAALYSYILSNPEKSWVFPWLFWVPFGLCASMIWHLPEEHRMVAKAGKYIGTELESWIDGRKAAQPKGWESFLDATAGQQEPLA
ncbi:MAG: hypothetical protein ABSE22_05405 [Xanthobacteraceae bacterium]|jgi:hypothetical protein